MEARPSQIIVLVLGMFFVTLGFSIIMPILPYYTRQMGASAFDLGLLMASWSAMQLIFTPFWGALSDRIGRKPIILIGLFGYGASFMIYGFATRLWMLFAARVTGGILAGGIYPASLAYIADITGHRDRGRIMGLLGAASGLGMIFGPSISGILTNWGLSTPFFVTAIAAFIFGIIGYLFLEESRSVDVHHPIKVEKASIIPALGSPLAILFALMLLVTFLMSGFQSVFAYYMGGRFGLYESPSSMPLLWGSVMLTGPTAMALLFTVMGIMGVICQGVLVGHLISRIGEGMTVLIGMLAYAAGFIMIGMSGELASIMLFSSLIAIGMGLATPSLNSMVSKATDEEHQGAMLGVLGSYGSLGRVAGPPIGGLAFDIGTGLPYALSGVLSLAGAAISYIAIKRIKIKQ